MQNEHLYSVSANEIEEKGLELKDLPPHLEYAYLKGDESYQVIISSKLKEKRKFRFCECWKNEKGAIAWKMSDIKGISPSFCIHKVLIEESFKPVIQPQRRLNPKVQDVVKNEIVNDFAVRAVLGQRIEGKFNTIYYAGKTLNDAKAHYTTIEKELLVVVFSFDKFRPYLILSKTVVYTDHSALKLKNPNMGELAEEEITNKFLDEHMMILESKPNDKEPWHADYVNYIVKKVVPPKWTPKRKNNSSLN
uniref:Reverse transcriptase RNase H-like domain-containing protein n=1 Tax=Tanacetum cinerariifolium TaxID=118510 RepID=A0A6L2J7E7_TANCI|nr:hypothetical protein [Tanacetum cinerariifolium]